MLLLSQLLSPPPPQRLSLRRLRPSCTPFPFPPNPSFKTRNPTTISADQSSAHPLYQTLDSLKPFVLSQHEPIIRGWLCSLVSVYSLSQIVPRVGKLSSLLPNIDASSLKTDGLVLGLLVLARLLAGYWQQAFLWDAAANAAYRLRVHIFEKVLETDLSFFEGSRVVPAGDIAYRIASEASDVADTVYALLNTIVPSILQLSTMAIQMLGISPVLSLISALVIPCMSLVVILLGERLRKISREAQLSIAALSAYLNEVLPAILFIKANNVELCENVKFQRLALDDLSKRLQKKKMKALIPQIVQTIYFVVLSIICIGSLAISGGSFDGCSVISFVTSLVLMIEPIQGVGKAYNELKEGEPAIERLFDLTRFRSKVIENPGAVDLDCVAGEVRYCDVSFKYGDNMPLVLDELNLCIEAGETVALVGPSGGGKTTLVKLLLRLYDPLSGGVLVDNHDIKNIRSESLRKHIGLVSQDITLFSGTVADNIGYKDLTTEIDMDRVKHAAQIANADEFITALPDGYETNIGPRGCVLSGGQKQRLAIARALYQDPSILILDEATSALDSRSELLVRQAVQRLMQNRTVLVIAHRLETVLMANRIFILDDGKLKELARSSLLAYAAKGIVI